MLDRFGRPQGNHWKAEDEILNENSPQDIREYNEYFFTVWTHGGGGQRRLN